jgi:hypothetical protein
MKKRKKRKVPSKGKRRVPIDKLFAYWVALSKRPILTNDDFHAFILKARETCQHFHDTYPVYANEDKFLGLTSIVAYWPENYFKRFYETQHLTDGECALMKNTARKFIARIKKLFGQQLALSHFEKTPLQDAETLISSSTKLTYRWAAGIIASNQIARLLIRLSRKYRSGEKFPDDIKTLYVRLKSKTENPKLKRFLDRSYRRFEDANKTRNRCAHINEGEPTRQEIEQSISLGRMLERFV